MSNVSFYDEFHKESSVQKEIIKRNNFTYITVISIIESQISKWIKKSNKDIQLLDFGCGAGTLSFYFAARGVRVTGIDISNRAISLTNKSAKKLKLEGNISFYHLNKEKSKLKNKKYDVVLCLEVIEHVEKDKELVKSLVKKLNKGGILIVSTPLISAPLNRLGLTNTFDKKVGHLRRYSKDKLIKFMLSLPGIEFTEYIVTEGILRNSLYVFPFLGIFIRFIKCPIAYFVTIIDFILMKLFGGSNIFVVVRKL